MQVEKRRFQMRYVQIKYLEASWPGAQVAHRIHPLHGTMNAHTNKRHRSDPAAHQHARGDVQQSCYNYRLMLQNLMDMIQDYLFISDNNIERGALSSLELVKNTARVRGDNRICIWLEDVCDEPRAPWR